MLILFLVIAGAASFLLFKTLFSSKKAIEPEEQFSWESHVEAIEDLTDQSTEKPEQAPQKASRPDPKQLEVKQPTPFERVSENLIDFFSNLKEQDYIAAYEIKEPLQDYSNKLIIKLLNNPPIISEETDDLFTVLKNTAHFYRVLGHKDI